MNIPSTRMTAQEMEGVVRILVEKVDLLEIAVNLIAGRVGALDGIGGKCGPGKKEGAGE